MDGWMIFLRLVHIIAGAYWLGGILLWEFVFQPRLARLGPQTAGPVNRVAAPAIGTSVALTSVLVIATGAAIALRMRWGSLDRFLVDGWGWAIFAGFVASVAALAVGGAGVSPAATKAAALYDTFQGRAPTPEEGIQMMGLVKRISKLTRITAGLVLIAVATMAVARYV